MRIDVSAIRPNPHRDMERYVLDQRKVETLTASISKTGFWDNLVVRKGKEDGTYELAYGHHRLEALRRSGISQVELPVKKLTDTQMLQIMADENATEWHQSTTVVNETILAVRNFISSEIGDARILEDLPDSVRWLFDTKDALNAVWINSGSGQLSRARIGRPVIQKFLGDTWGERTIKGALEILDSKYADTQVSESFSSPGHARSFARSVDIISKAQIPLSKEDQQEIVDEILEEELASPDNSKLSSARIQDKVFQKAQEKIGPVLDQEARSKSSVVKDAYTVRASEALSQCRKYANQLPEIFWVSESSKVSYIKRCEEIITILKEKMEDAING